MNSPKYAVISPVRNEAEHLQLTIDSMISQTIPPVHWIIVDDGSTDDTGRIAEQAARLVPWITVVHRADRGFRKAGGGVVDAFYEGYRLIESESLDYIVKLDGDLSFSADYFARCFDHFNADERLGIAGGTVYIKLKGELQIESKDDPRFHVRGASKIYRWTCWRAIGQLIRMPGWDTMDEVKANMLGWVTVTFSDLRIIHHRPTGAAYGAWRDRVKNGLGCYVMGYHPLFMLLKSARRITERPYFVGSCGLLFGFLKGYLCNVPRIQDKPLVTYLRQQQMSRLLFRKSLWDS